MDHYLSNINIDINGAQATGGTSDTDKSFQLAHPIVSPPHTHLLVALKTFSIPYAFYLINEGINDQITITCDSATGGTVSETLTITPGTYSIQELRTHLNSMITSIFGNLNLDSLSLNIDQSKVKLYFSLSYSTHTLNYIEFSATAYREVGLISGQTTRFTGVTTGYFDKIFNLMGNAQLFVRLKNYQMDSRNMSNVSGIISAIPINIQPMGKIAYDAPELIFYKLNSQQINNIDVQILDQDMNALGDLLMSGEFRMSLIIKFSWDKDIMHRNILEGKTLYSTHIEQPKSNIDHAEKEPHEKPDQKDQKEQQEDKPKSFEDHEAIKTRSS
jgi:hypothetical protein